MAKLNFASQSYQARSTQLIAMQCINAFMEPTPKDATTEAPVYGIPGLARFIEKGRGPILGMHLMQNNLFFLSGGDLCMVSANDVIAASPGAGVPATMIGTTTISSLASMADNSQQLVMVDGDAAWIYQPGGLYQVTTTTENAGATSLPANITGTITSGDPLYVALDNGAFHITTAASTVTHFDNAIVLTDPIPSTISAGGVVIDTLNVLAPITAPAFMPASTVRYLDGYFVFNARDTRQFFLSAINDGTQYSGLDFATASAGSTFVKAVEVYHEQLLIMCADHTEIWWNSGALSFPFQRFDAAFIARGIAASLATASEDNTVFWMGDDGIFYRLEGFNPKRVSTFAMEHAWAQYPLRYLDASCFVLDQEGHKFVVVNLPSGNATWVYDISSTLWAERQSSSPAFLPPALPTAFPEIGLDSGSGTQANAFAGFPGPSGSGFNGFPASFRYALQSTWIEFPAGSEATGIFLTAGFQGGGPAGLIADIFPNPADFITVTLYDAAATQIGSVVFDPPSDMTGRLSNILISADSVGNVIQCYVNGVACTINSQSWASTNEMGNGADLNDWILYAPGPHLGTGFCGAAFYFAAPSAFFDLSDPDNISAFIRPDGYPKSLGIDGSTPTGEIPAVYLALNPGEEAETFLFNRGSGGVFSYLQGGPNVLHLCTETYPPA